MCIYIYDSIGTLQWDWGLLECQLFYILSESSQGGWGLGCERSIRTTTCSVRRLSLGSEWGRRAGRQGTQDHIFHHSHFCLGLVSSACVHAAVIQYLSLNLNMFELVFWGIRQLRHLRPLAMGHKMHLTWVWYKYLPLYRCIALFSFCCPYVPYTSISQPKFLEKLREILWANKCPKREQLHVYPEPKMWQAVKYLNLSDLHHT